MLKSCTLKSINLKKIVLCKADRYSTQYIVFATWFIVYVYAIQTN